jgi:hypothetical protein
LCSAGKPEESNSYQLNAHSMELFHGDGQKKQAFGDIKALNMYNRSLLNSEVRIASNCAENYRAQSCPNLITFSTSAPRTSYSTVFGGDKPGEGYGRGRLNSKSAWCAGNTKVGQWWDNYNYNFYYLFTIYKNLIFFYYFFTIFLLFFYYFFTIYKNTIYLLFIKIYYFFTIFLLFIKRIFT